MPEDVAAALGRFQTFLETFSMDDIIEPTSGFSAADAQLLLAEFELAEKARREALDNSSEE